MKEIVIIAEILAEEIRPVTWELITAARKLKSLSIEAGDSAKIRVVIPAADPEPMTEKFSRETGLDCIALKNAEFKNYNSDLYIHCLGKLLKAINPAWILVGHTAIGNDFAPGLAFDLSAAIIPAVNDIRCDNGNLLYSRPAFNNRKNLLIEADNKRPHILTILPGSWKRANHKPEKPGSVSVRAVSFMPANYDKDRIQPQRIIKKDAGNQALKNAKIIVAAGRGIKEKENLAIIHKFAQSFPGAAVGASRPLVDMGWIGYEHQVGITGATVTPELYIACGISGSSQHLAGMKNSKFVVAINQNPKAPIFRHADIGVNADVIEFIEYFTNKTKRLNPTTGWNPAGSKVG